MKTENSKIDYTLTLIGRFAIAILCLVTAFVTFGTFLDVASMEGNFIIRYIFCCMAFFGVVLSLFFFRHYTMLIVGVER